MRKNFRRTVLFFVIILVTFAQPAQASNLYNLGSTTLPPTPFSKLPPPISALSKAYVPASVFDLPPRAVELNRSTNDPVDPSKPMIALTFDDGPSHNTTRILETLKLYGGRATFCVIGQSVIKNPDIVRQAYSQGSEIANHTYTHKNLTKITPEEILSEITTTADAVESITGERPLFLRAPYGSVDDVVRSVTRDLGMPIVKWSIDTNDWKTRDAESTYKSIIENVRDGSIILCHDLYGETADAMEYVIPELTAQGYQLVTVSELLSYKKDTVLAGHEYK